MQINFILLQFILLIGCSVHDSENKESDQILSNYFRTTYESEQKRLNIEPHFDSLFYHPFYIHFYLENEFTIPKDFENKPEYKVWKSTESIKIDRQLISNFRTIKLRDVTEYDEIQFKLSNQRLTFSHSFISQPIYNRNKNRALLYEKWSHGGWRYLIYSYDNKNKKWIEDEVIGEYSNITK